MNWKKLFFVIFIAFMGLQCQPDSLSIYLIGDSTMADKEPEKFPETGWGQMLHTCFNDKITVKNHARNGRSTKSFIDEGLWKVVFDSLKSGDYVFIQFGHNDQKDYDSTRYTDPYGSYMANLRKFVEESKSKGAVPVLLTSVMRRRFDENGNFYDTHGDYPAAVRELASELSVQLIDLHKSSQILIEEYGEEKSKELFLWVDPGQNDNYPQGKQDNTHFSEKGATLIAKLVADEIKMSDSKLADYLK